MTWRDIGNTVYLISTRLHPRSVHFTGIDADLLAKEYERRPAVVTYSHSNLLRNVAEWQQFASHCESSLPSCELLVILACSLSLPSDTIRDVSAILINRCDRILFVNRSESLRDPVEWGGCVADWAEAFVEQGFSRDLSFENQPFDARMLLFQRMDKPIITLVAQYEHNLQVALSVAREALDLARAEIERSNVPSMHGDLVAQIDEVSHELDAWRHRWLTLEAGLAWPIVGRLQSLRARFAPEGSMISRLLGLVENGVRGARELDIEPIPSLTTPTTAFGYSLDVIVCVHNALEDVRKCLASVRRHTELPYRLILVDDGSDQPTRDYLSEFAGAHGVTLLRNETAQGYTIAANQGLHASTAEFVVLLNSDTVVTPNWLERMVFCAISAPDIGLVGPLSNTASWQSIPELADGDDWATNTLPKDMTVSEMGRLVAKYSMQLYPKVPFLNGFCLMIRREVLLDLGYFDESRFGQGYGEEDDYALRARGKGWQLAIADDVYVYHAQSRSYSNERRHTLSSQALTRLIEKHGKAAVKDGVDECQNSRVLRGIRARARVLFERWQLIRRGAAKYAGRRVLFILPVATPGGGANVVISEAKAMQEMGVEVKIFNLRKHRRGFESAYTQSEVPVVYGDPWDITEWATRYHAVIATHNESVAWLDGLSQNESQPVRGYYIQGFEPYMYPEGSQEYKRALTTYVLYPELVRFAKTDWTRDMLRSALDISCKLVLPSYEIDRFCPRARSRDSWPRRKLNVAAMIRPDAPYRAPQLTMEVLRKAKRQYRRQIEIWVFGVDSQAPGFGDLPQDFVWYSAGVLAPEQVARFLNEVDIFVDFSEHQAMGLTAMEAMACGVAVIAPQEGGAVSFIDDGRNGLIIDTHSPEACYSALATLITDHQLRQRLQENAIHDIVRYFPERSALGILDALFSSGER